MAGQEFQAEQQISDAAANCPIQASPHQAIFDGPFHDRGTVTQCSVKNVSTTRLIINIKVSEPVYLRSSPRCFFLEPGQTIVVRFEHQPFTMNPEETYDRHQIGFFYLGVMENYDGTAKELKHWINENAYEWGLCRMRVAFNFTEEDQQAAYHMYNLQQQYGDQQGVQV